MKRFFSCLLSIVIIISMVPSTFATEIENDSFSLRRYDFTTQEESIVTVPALSTYSTSPRVSRSSNPVGTRIIVDDIDTRTPVTTVTTSPYYSIVQLKMDFSNGKTGYGTGFMISENVLLTAGHCLFCTSEPSLRASEVTVYAGRNGSSYTTSTTAAVMYTDTEYTFYGDSYDYDYAIITLEDPIGETTGWLGLYVSPLTGFYAGRSILTAGYPGDKTGSEANTMWVSSGTIRTVNDMQFSHTADAWEGQSGSPVYYNNVTYGYVALGIHVGGVQGGTLNYAKRITVTLFDWLESEGYINS